MFPGNHDITLDANFYAQHSLNFHNQYPQVSEDCIRLLSSSPSITYLNHETKQIRLTKEGGPRTTFKIFGSPYSPVRGLWAFSYSPDEAVSIWNNVPLDADIVVTHTPPKYHCDESKDRRAAGCESLRQSLWRVRPRLAICGHVHEGRGIQRVQWDLTSPNVEFKESSTSYWIDPGMNNKKQSFVDLSSRSNDPLINHMEEVPEYDSQLNDKKDTNHKGPSTPEFPSCSSKEVHDPPKPLTRIQSQDISCDFVSERLNDMQDDVALCKSGEQLFTTLPSSAIRGQGRLSSYGRCDVALKGRLGRQETCIVNAAIMASSWPRKGSAGKKYNKPIVVDLDLPTWDSVSDI